MKLTYVACAVLTVLCISLKTFAQQGEYRVCDTEIMWQKALQKDPALIEKAKKSLEFFREYAGPDQKVETSSLPVIYIIPTVFHVIHDYGIEDISKAQILDAMDILNKSFQKLNDDTNDVIPIFQPIFADCQIEFRLATLDPSGNCTDGITRIQSEYTYNADDNVKGLIDWPSNKYLNIWVVSNIASGAAGYSYYPGISASDDGIVIRHDYVGGIGTSNGSNYTERSLTHEVGHWLNLPHTWGSTNTPGDPSNCGIDDGVFDTPNTAGTNNFSCNTNQNTCGQIDNVQNYMDYASCHKMFTNGQKARMHAALNSSIGQRNNLSTPSNLAATGTEDGTLETICNPVADFSDRKLSICSGTQVHYKDLSWGDDVTSWQWTFPGGTPSTSTSANPVIQYDVPGIYDVTLEVSNVTGTSQLTRTAFVQVLEDTGLITVPYSEGFETISLSNAGWTIENPDNNNAWDITTTTGSAGSSKSLRLINQTGNSSGSKDAIISPVMNFVGVSGVTMNFDVAFARKNNSEASSLKVSATNNCGQGWMIRYNKSGGGLETAPLSTSAFAPTALQWRTETVSLISGSISGKPAVRLKFEFVNDQGNNIYIDNINITGNTNAIDALDGFSEFNLFPNPSQGDFHVSFTLEKKRDILYSIKDITGREIISETKEFEAGNHEMTIANKLVPGIYIFTISSGNSQYTQKLIAR